jgi:hypothetical protein
VDGFGGELSDRVRSSGQAIIYVVIFTKPVVLLIEVRRGVSQIMCSAEMLGPGSTACVKG